MTVANRRATTWATRSLFPLSLDFARSWTRIIMVSSQARRWGFLARMVRGEGFQSCLYNCSFSHGPLQALGAWAPGLRFLRLCRLNAPLLSRNCCSHSSITCIPRIVVRTLSIKLLRVLCLQIGVRPRLQTRKQRSAQVLCYLETGLFALMAIAKPKSHQASCNRLCKVHTHTLNWACRHACTLARMHACAYVFLYGSR